MRIPVATISILAFLAMNLNLENMTELSLVILEIYMHCLLSASTGFLFEVSENFY